MSQITLHNEAHRTRALGIVAGAPLGYRVSVAEPKHSTEQRGKLNAMCGDLAKQCDHAGLKLSKDDWRHLIAAMVFKLRIVPDLDGSGIVSLAPSTSQMSVKELNAMIEGAYYVGSTRNVVWTDPEYAAEGAPVKAGAYAG